MVNAEKTDNINDFLKAIEIFNKDQPDLTTAIELAVKHFPILYKSYVNEILFSSGLKTTSYYV